MTTSFGPYPPGSRAVSLQHLERWQLLWLPSGWYLLSLTLGKPESREAGSAGL